MSRIGVELHGRPLTIVLTAAAERALAARTAPLLAEMELYFSCLLRKRVRFHETGAGRAGTAAHPRLHVRFHPVMTRRCAVGTAGAAPPLTDFPMRRLEAFVPRWLHVDCGPGGWRGTFGFDDPPAR